MYHLYRYTIYAYSTCSSLHVYFSCKLVHFLIAFKMSFTRVACFLVVALSARDVMNFTLLLIVGEIFKMKFCWQDKWNNEFFEK